MKLAFVTDTGTGFSPEELQKEGIYGVSLQVEWDGISYDEYETMSYEQVIHNLYAEKIMKTSLPRLGKIEELFETIKADGYDSVFCVPICRGLSGAFVAMAMMAEQVGLRFYGVDCYSTAVVQRRLIEIAKELFESGASIEEIMERMHQIVDTCETVLLCDDLQHMKRGGRLTPMAAALGGLLKIKPILHLDKETQGKVDVLDKVRTMTKAQEHVINYLIERGVNQDYRIIVAHVDAREAALKYADRIRSCIKGASIEVIDLVSAVSVHTGLGCLAVQAFKE